MSSAKWRLFCLGELNLDAVLCWKATIIQFMSLDAKQVCRLSAGNVVCPLEKLIEAKWYIYAPVN